MQSAGRTLSRSGPDVIAGGCRKSYRRAGAVRIDTRRHAAVPPRPYMRHRCCRSGRSCRKPGIRPATGTHCSGSRCRDGSPGRPVPGGHPLRGRRRPKALQSADDGSHHRRRDAGHRHVCRRRHRPSDPAAAVLQGCTRPRRMRDHLHRHHRAGSRDASTPGERGPPSGRAHGECPGLSSPRQTALHRVARRGTGATHHARAARAALPAPQSSSAGGVSTCTAASTYTSGAFQLIATSLLA